jgi:hypothetical protein
MTTTATARHPPIAPCLTARVKPPVRRRRLLTSAVVGLVLLSTLAACGGGGGDDDATKLAKEIAAQSKKAADSAAKEPDANGSGTGTGTTKSTVKPITRTIGKTGSYEGFAITVVDATAEETSGFSGSSASVKVDFSYKNLGTEPTKPPEADIEVAGESAEGFYDTPRIPGEGTAKGSVTVTVANPASSSSSSSSSSKKAKPIDLDKALDTVTLVYGDAADNQTKIPLAASGTVSSIEPKKLTTTGTITQGQLIVELKSATFSPSYESGEKGKGLLDVRFKLSCSADCQGQGHGVGVEEFSLKLPDGTSVVADDRSEYCCDAIYPGTVSDGERNVLTFVVPLPGTGSYTFVFNNKDTAATGVPAATFQLTV